MTHDDHPDRADRPATEPGKPEYVKPELAVLPIKEAMYGGAVNTDGILGSSGTP